MFGNTPRKQTIIQSIGNGARFVCLFFYVFSAQVNGTLTQKISDQNVCEQSSPRVNNPQLSQNDKIDKIQNLFTALSDRCAENEFYDQVLACMIDLFAMIKNELKKDVSCKLISTNSIAAKSTFFKMADFLAKDTRQSFLIDLKKVYFLVAPVFKWDGRFKNRLFTHYRNEHCWRIVKDWSDGPVKVMLGFAALVLVPSKLLNLSSYWNGKAEKDRRLSELENKMSKFEGIAKIIDSLKKTGNIDELEMIPMNNVNHV